MANLTEIDEFTTGIYQIETTDSVEGGALGISNIQARSLGNRTLWLKNRLTGFFPRELKWISGVSNDFINTNFPSGIGTGIYLGWFVANGANGTEDMGGIVAIGQGNGYTVGNTGGSRDAVVVAHTHEIYTTSYNLAGSGGAEGVLRNGVPGVSNGKYTQSTGTSGLDKNMQPYRVALCIQYIP